MKVLHIADCHLGANPFGTRSEDFFRAWFWFLGEAAQTLEPGDAVVMAGDVFDAPLLLPREIDAFNMAMERLVRRLGLKVFLIEGNHDTSSKKEVSLRGGGIMGGAWPEYFQSQYGPDNVFVEEIDQDTGLPKPFVIGEGLNAVSICPINYRPKTVIRDIMARMPRDYATILIMHQSVEGAVPLISDPDLRLEDLSGKATYVALGDLHIRWASGQLRDERRDEFSTLAAYPGPLEWCRISEAHMAGLISLEFLGGRLISFSRVENPVSRRYVRLETKDGLADAFEAFSRAGLSADDIVRVPLGFGTLVWGTFNQGYPGMIYLDVKYPHSPDEVAKNFANEVFQAAAQRLPLNTCLGGASKLPSVDRNFDFVDTTQSSVDGTITMEGAIMELHEDDHPKVTEAALAIWSSPTDLHQIIEHATEPNR